MYNYGSHKVVAVLASNLEPGVALNVMGHMAISLGAHCPGEQLMGRPILRDASGVEHAGISRYPVIVTKVKSSKIRRLLNEVRSIPDVFVADYPEEMLSTGHDDELAEALEARDEEDLRYLGVVLFGPASVLEKLTGRFTLWK